MTESEARKLVAVAVAACPTQGGKMGRDQIADMGTAWTMLLEDIDYADGSAALKRWLATSHWLPAPAQIRTIVSEAKHGRRRPGGDAWGDVLSEVGRTGRYRSPKFADPVVARAVDALGWVNICDSENQHADRARFVELYDRLAAMVAEDQSVGSLPGVARPALPERTGETSLGAAVLRALPTPEKPNA
jgi:hypothetical protein